MQILLHNYSALYFIIITLVAFLITVFTIPSVMHVSKIRHLYDDLGHFRKQHDHGIPRLGGVAIFVSFTITSLLFSMTDKSLPINYLLTGCIILFAMGLKDDLSGVNPNTKFIIQLVVGSIIVILGNVRLTSLYGLFGVYDLSYIPSVMLSIILIVMIVNAFNLIDGINGLAATTGIIAMGAFGGLFIYIHQYQLAAVSLAMAGAILGFLKFNLTPAKIFMGDTGALLIGLISAVMAIKFIEITKLSAGGSPQIYSSPMIALAILIGPIFDTVRVFIIRSWSGVSPFIADRNHIHHRLLKVGFDHIQTTLILALSNLICIGMALMFQDRGNSFLILFIVLMPLCFNWTITFSLRSAEREKVAFRNLFV